MYFHKKLKGCNNIADIFELVKEIAYKYLKKEQAGLLLGLSDLGKFPRGFIGAFYSPYSNMIIVNNRVINKIEQDKPKLLKPYLFYIILHEYIHSLGFYDEEMTKQIVYLIAQELQHEDIIKLSINLQQYFPEIVFSNQYEMPKDINIDFILGIDKQNTNYIA